MGAAAALSAAVECPAKTAAPQLFVTPNEFRGTDVERINRAIEAAASAGCRVVIPRNNLTGGQRKDAWMLDSAILLRSHTTLELDNCRLKLSDRCRDNFMRSANWEPGTANAKPLQDIHIRGIGAAVLEGAGHPRATGDSAKTLGKRTYGTDAGKAGESQTGDWRNLGILLMSVEGFSIENLAMKDSHSWAISLEHCAHGTLRDLAFDSSGFKMIDGKRETILNQDGIDLRLGCHDILIENITGQTGDDLIALTAIPHGGTPAGPEDDIRDVIVRNIKGYCRGGHHIVRLLNTPGVRMHDILIDGLIDTSPVDMQCKAAVKIGDTAYGGGIAPLGETRRIIVNNVISRSKYTILIGGSLCDSIISNIIRVAPSGEAVTVASGPQYMRDVTISNVRVVRE
ncbi:MAG: glycosyl hydrolase family 28 protein [Bryobacteraceae bacterium]